MPPEFSKIVTTDEINFLELWNKYELQWKRRTGHYIDYRRTKEMLKTNHRELVLKLKDCKDGRYFCRAKTT